MKAMTTALALGLLSGGAVAAPVSFTWDPSKAVPSLGGSSFTADDMTLTNYLHSTNQADGSFVEQFYQPITGFTLGGAPVAAPGLNSLYGLYLSISAVGKGVSFTSLDISLVADVHDNDGTPTATLGTPAAPGTIAFSNPAGVADDIVLGSGSLLTASLSRDPVTGIRSARFLDTFRPAPGETGFFLLPDNFNHIQIQVALTTPPSAFTARADSAQIEP